MKDDEGKGENGVWDELHHEYSSPSTYLPCGGVETITFQVEMARVVRGRAPLLISYSVLGGPRHSACHSDDKTVGQGLPVSPDPPASLVLVCAGGGGGGRWRWREAGVGGVGRGCVNPGTGNE